MKSIIIIAFMAASIVTTPALAHLVASITSGTAVRHIIGRNPVIGHNNLIVGGGAARSLWNGSCNIVVGHDDVPNPGASNYLNVDGIVYPNNARLDPEFQSLVMRRASEVARETGNTVEPAMINYYFGRGVCGSVDLD